MRPQLYLETALVDASWNHDLDGVYLGRSDQKHAKVTTFTREAHRSGVYDTSVFGPGLVKTVRSS